MRTTLIYTDCVANSAGDYSAAGEIAYALQSYYSRINDFDNEIILASSPKGVAKFDMLYGNKNAISTAMIHGKSFPFTSLNDYAANCTKKVDQYIEVGVCKLPDIKLVATIVDPLSTKIMSVGLPHYTENFDVAALNRFPQSSANKLTHAVHLGLGTDHIGIPFSQGPFEPLCHDVYQDLTKAPYGFAYLKSNILNFSFIIKDYLSVATNLTQPYQNFILVGNDKSNINSIKKFVLAEQKTVEVYEAKKSKFLRFKPLGNRQGIVKEHIDQFSNRENEKEIIRICSLKHVPHEQMRSLMKNALPLVGVEGVNSSFEAIQLGKIPFVQSLDHDQLFFDTYQETIKKLIPNKHKQALSQFFEYYLRKEKLTKFSKEALKYLINDSNFCEALSQAQIQLCNQLPDTGLVMAQKLNQPGNIDDTYQGLIFNDEQDQQDDVASQIFNGFLEFLELKLLLELNNRKDPEPINSKEEEPDNLFQLFSTPKLHSDTKEDTQPSLFSQRSKLSQFCLFAPPPKLSIQDFDLGFARPKFSI